MASPCGQAQRADARLGPGNDDDDDDDDDDVIMLDAEDDDGEGNVSEGGEVAMGRTRDTALCVEDYDCCGDDDAIVETPGPASTSGRHGHATTHSGAARTHSGAGEIVVLIDEDGDDDDESHDEGGENDGPSDGVQAGRRRRRDDDGVATTTEGGTSSGRLPRDPAANTDEGEAHATGGAPIPAQATPFDNSGEAPHEQPHDDERGDQEDKDAPPAERKPAEELLCSSERGEIPSANEAAAFIKSLQRFLQNSFGVQIGQKYYKVPRVGGQDLDLALLYRTVLDAGGHDAVTQARLWKTVGERMQIPSTITGQSTYLKQHYHKFLLPYERNYRCRKMVLNEYGRSDAYAHLPRDDVEQIPPRMQAEGDGVATTTPNGPRGPAADAGEGEAHATAHATATASIPARTTPIDVAPAAASDEQRHEDPPERDLALAPSSSPAGDARDDAELLQEMKKLVADLNRSVDVPREGMGPTRTGSQSWRNHLWTTWKDAKDDRTIFVGPGRAARQEGDADRDRGGGHQGSERVEPAEGSFDRDAPNSAMDMDIDELAELDRTGNAGDGEGGGTASDDIDEGIDGLIDNGDEKEEEMSEDEDGENGEDGEGYVLLSVGAKVRGNYGQDGVWYKGVIKRVYEDNYYDIEYEDGDAEERVARGNIKEPLDPIEECADNLGFRIDHLSKDEKRFLPEDIVRTSSKAKEYCCYRNVLLFLWRKDVKAWVRFEDAYERVRKVQAEAKNETAAAFTSGDARYILGRAYAYLTTFGWINFGLSPDVVSNATAVMARSPKTVIVIGAGLSGLAATRQLLSLGHRVVTLEGRDRPGGRVFSLQLKSEDGRVTGTGELGGSIIYGGEWNPLSVLVKQIGGRKKKFTEYVDVYDAKGSTWGMTTRTTARNGATPTRIGTG